MTRISEKYIKGIKNESVNKLMKYSYLMLIIIPLIIFFPSVKNGYVYFDDDLLILKNQSKIGDPANLFKTFTTDAFFDNSSPYYRPMLNVSFMFDAQVAKTNPAFYHFMNLVYHILCCLSLFWFLQLLGFRKEKALFGALLFSVHPLTASAVLWIPARNDLLVALFSLLFLSLSITWFRTKKPVLLPAAILSFALAVFSKESGILLPLILILYLFSTRQFTVDKEKVLLAVGILFVGILWFLLRLSAVSMVGSWQLGLWAVAANFAFPFEIIGKFFIPYNMAVTPVFTPFFTGVGIFSIILILLFFFIRKEKAVWLFVFGFVWYVSFSLPNMFVRLDNAPDSYDYLVHRSYLPLAGFIILLLAVIPDYWVAFSSKIKLAVLSILLLFLGVNSLFLGTKYKNAESFWNAAIVYNPQKAWFYHFLGRFYFMQKDYVTYEKYARIAISLKKDPNFLYSLGLVYFLEKKSYDSAFLLFNEARSTGYNVPEANAMYINLCIESARNLYQKGEYAQAVARCQIAVDLDPKNPTANYNMGLYLVYAGNAKRAATFWRRSLILDPELKEAYRNLYYYYRDNTSNQDSVNYFAREFRNRGGAI